MSHTVLISQPVDEAILANLGTAARLVHLPIHQAALLGHDERLAVDFVASVINGEHETFIASVDWDDLKQRMHIQMGRFA